MFLQIITYFYLDEENEIKHPELAKESTAGDRTQNIPSEPTPIPWYRGDEAVDAVQPQAIKVEGLCNNAARTPPRVGRMGAYRTSVREGPVNSMQSLLIEFLGHPKQIAKNQENRKRRLQKIKEERRWK